MQRHREWSLSCVRPVMKAMPSLISFLDFAVTGSMDDEGQVWDGCELIEVSDFASFERDNEVGEGAVLALAWRARLASWSIGYLEDLEDLEVSDASG